MLHAKRRARTETRITTWRKTRQSLAPDFGELKQRPVAARPSCDCQPVRVPAIYTCAEPPCGKRQHITVERVHVLSDGQA